MTNEEAINYLRGCFAPTCNICPIRCESADISQEARQIATQALEKQIPKKPNRTARPYVCPICATPIVVEANELPNHCRKCGQRLEWNND